MCRIVQPKHFKAHDFVPQLVMKQLDDRAIMVMDYRILKTADALVDYFDDEITINDWYYGGTYNLRGFRPAWQFVGIARYNAHNFGRAIDFTCRNVDAEEVRNAILKHQIRFPYITAMQADVPWVHIETNLTMSPRGIFLFTQESGRAQYEEVAQSIGD